MIDNIRGTHAYDFNGNEVDTLGRANILVVDTDEAAQELLAAELSEPKEYSNISNVGWPFEKSGIYVAEGEFDNYWSSLDKYTETMLKTLNHYNSIYKIIISLAKENGGN